MGIQIYNRKKLIKISVGEPELCTEIVWKEFKKGGFWKKDREAGFYNTWSNQRMSVAEIYAWAANLKLSVAVREGGVYFHPYVRYRFEEGLEVMKIYLSVEEATNAAIENSDRILGDSQFIFE